MTTISMMNTTFNYQDFLYKMNISVPLFYNNVLDKMNTTTNYTLIYENVKDCIYMTYLKTHDDLKEFMYLNNEILTRAFPIIIFIMLVMYLITDFNYKNKKLQEKYDFVRRSLHNSKQENQQLQEEMTNLKNDKKKMRRNMTITIKHLKKQNEKLREKNYHQVNGLRKSLRLKKKQQIIEEIKDVYNIRETYNIYDSIKEIYKKYPGMKFDDEKMYKYIKKHPKLKNSRSKTPIRTMNHYLQKLKQKRFLKRELVEGKYYYSE